MTSLSSIIVTISPHDAYCDLDELLEALLEFPALEELVLDYEVPRNILKTLEKRGVYWKRELNGQG